MRRREFIAALGSAAVWPLTARAQRVDKAPTIGLLGSSTATAQGSWIAAFVKRLHDLGWIEGRTVNIEYRWAEGRSERFTEIAGEFVRLKVDVIFALGTEATLATKQATAFIPTIFSVVGDPLGTGLIASLARPGGNVTGLSIQSPDLGAKRLEHLREVLPSLRRLAFLANAGNATGSLELAEVQAACRTLGLDEVLSVEIRRTADILPAFVTIRSRADAIYIVSDPLANLNRMRINTFALAARLPTIYGQREYVEAGGLMSYGPNIPDLTRRAGDYVDKVLRGAKPSDLPVEQPTKFDLVINLITAQALGLEVPATLLARADEVIE
jgi:putative ABC transport system substrate-binding protein